jgi:hypothetical protein
LPLNVGATPMLLVVVNAAIVVITTTNDNEVSLALGTFHRGGRIAIMTTLKILALFNEDGKDASSSPVRFLLCIAENRTQLIELIEFGPHAY